MLNPWVGMGLVLAIFAALMVGLRRYRRSRSANPELVRKALHAGMGLVTLTFPWLFLTTWPVLILAGLFSLGLSAPRICWPLQRLVGDVIDGVGRKSLGTICFPLAVGILYVLSAAEPLTFCIPMLVLTCADSVAALIGGRYGTLRYSSAEGAKTLEGSVAFFSVTFLSTHIPLLLFTDTGRLEALLISLTLALLVTLLEAIARRGLDNLFIPLGTLVLLKSFFGLHATALAVCLGVALLLIALFALSSRRRSVADQQSWVTPRPSRWQLFLRMPEA